MLNKKYNFSWTRYYAIMLKEFLQMRRDRLTFGMIIGLPIIQLILFGLAINMNPKHLPTAIISGDQSAYTQTFVHALENTTYFKIMPNITTAKQAEKALEQGKVSFIISIPVNFSRDLIRGNTPQLLVEADASDPTGTSGATTAIAHLANNVFNPLAHGATDYLHSKTNSFQMIIHAKYNPEAITQYNIVPGLLGVILTMTLVMITSMGITREREKGTMETLLSMPVTPLEVSLGKVTPYIFVGYIQFALILIAAIFVFHVPMAGSMVTLIIATLPFIAANLALGLTFSSIAASQLQAMQMTFFFFLPSILLSGFMFPFAGMPQWAQYIGQALPLTHFLRIVRGIMLKGNSLSLIMPDMWAIIIFALIVIIIGIKSYKRTIA